MKFLRWLLEIPMVPLEFSPKTDLVLRLGSKEARAAYVQAARAQQRAWAFASQHLRKTKPNPDLKVAWLYPEVADAPRTVIDAYGVLMNRSIQAWNVLAKIGGLPLLPSLRRGRSKRRLLIDYGPPVPLPPLLPEITREESRMEFLDAEALYDTEVIVPGPLHRPPPVCNSLIGPGVRRMFSSASWRPRNSGPR